MSALRAQNVVADMVPHILDTELLVTQLARHDIVGIELFEPKLRRYVLEIEVFIALQFVSAPIRH